MASTMQLSNDTRGWIMASSSGLACILGASIICVDIIVRQFPGKRNWRIQDSNTFLSLSLSLSFGVMLFSALYSMLPSSKTSLVAGGYSSKQAAWILIACFIGGVIGIQIIAGFLHRCFSHKVAVPCEHTHGDEEAYKEGADAHEHREPHNRGHAHEHNYSTSPSRVQAPVKTGNSPPMQQRLSSQQPNPHASHRRTGRNNVTSGHNSPSNPSEPIIQRPTLRSQISETFQMLTTGKNPECSCDGPCYGYTDVCQSNCFKTVNARGGVKAPNPTAGINRPSAVKSSTATESTPLLHAITEETPTRPHTRALNENTNAHPSDSDLEDGPSDHSSLATATNTAEASHLHKTQSHETATTNVNTDVGQHQHDGVAEEVDEDQHHHHHVPKNAFLSIGLQTSIAIALHKLPEGFITYATNHANPKLGVSVFIALFVHNITEGFAMALPLYLAINNRFKAMGVSFVLGGLSQPVGAGVAALWFKLAGRSNWAPNETHYGCMFALTAGIMASVALQLFAESLDLTHSKQLCIAGAFVGMAILGCSSALTA